MRLEVTRSPLWMSALLGIVIAGCASKNPEAPTGPLNVRLVLGVGEIGDVQPASIRVQFQGVTSDSRCPADALCIQRGDAVVRIGVLSSGRQFLYDLRTDDMKGITHAELTIALVQLEPYPFSSRVIGPADYRATLRITR